MTRIQRRLLIDTSVIGFTLTFFVAILDYSSRILAPLDDWFYDRRASLCQFFTPKPTDKLIHINIDDQSLATIGQWPWPRAQLAEIIDEINNAGAKAISMDIIFSEPSNPSPRIEKIGPKHFSEIDDDAILAASIRRNGNCLVPLSIGIFQNLSPVYRKMREYLEADLELNEADCYKKLLADSEQPIPAGVKFPMDLYIGARRDAMNARITREVEKGDYAFSLVDRLWAQWAASHAHGLLLSIPHPAQGGLAEPQLEELRKRLLPRTDPEFAGSPLLRLLREEHIKVVALVPLRRFVLPIPGNLPPLPTYTTEHAPILPFSQAAAFSGYVDYLQTSESGVIRNIPLFADYRGRLLPQTDLALACAVLDVDIRTLRLSADKIVIPKPKGHNADIVIPVRGIYARQFDREVGMFMDIPDRGTRDWEFIYDSNRFKKSELHLSATTLWDVHILRERIARNNASVDGGLQTLLGPEDLLNPNAPPRLGIDTDQAKSYAEHPPAPTDTQARKKMIDYTVKKMKEDGIDVILTMKDEEFKDDRERAKRDELARALKNFDRVIDQNKRFENQLADLKAMLHDKISGRAVMIGWSATGHIDFFPTAIQPSCPGVVIHGMVFNAIMTQDFWRHAPKWITCLITILIGLLITAANGFLKPSVGLITAVLIGAAYLLINGLLLFDYGNLCVGVAGPMIALVSVWSTGALAGLLIEAAERARITKRFSNYVDPKLVDHVIENPDAVLDGQVREMSVIFTDLAGFTSLSEQLRERTVPILSEYLGLMVPLIRKNEGFVNKFLGDGIMCFYNAPNDDPEHAIHAVQTVLDMQKAMKGFAAQMAERGLPDVSMRCGVSTGQMVVGDSGPADASDYTVLGDAVNFASRLEGANKATGTNALISQRTSEMLGDKFLLRPVGKLQVVGKTEGVMTYEPLAPIDDATLEDRLCAASSAEMIAAFIARDFARCIQAADQMDKQFGPGKLPALYRKTAQECLTTPPGADFMGNLILTEK